MDQKTFKINGDPLVSVIVPVYNVQEFLPECLDSICKQTYQNLQIICVNDGSTDRSWEVMNEYKDRDSRISLASQKNQGLSAARNTGLKYVKGKYILFVDSDDFLDLDLCRKTVKKAEQSDADFVIYYYRFYPFNCNESPVFPFSEWNPDDKVNPEDKKEIITYCYAWSKLWRADFFKENKFIFPHGLHYEDNPIHWHAVALAQKISIVPEYLYCYRIREDSITRTHGCHLFEIFPIMKMIEKNLKSTGFYAQYSDAYRLHRLRLFECHHSLIRHDLKEGFYRELRKVITNEDVDFARKSGLGYLEAFYSDFEKAPLTQRIMNSPRKLVSKSKMMIKKMAKKTIKPLFMRILRHEFTVRDASISELCSKVEHGNRDLLELQQKINDVALIASEDSSNIESLRDDLSRFQEEISVLSSNLTELQSKTESVSHEQSEIRRETNQSFRKISELDSKIEHADKNGLDVQSKLNDLALNVKESLLKYRDLEKDKASLSSSLEKICIDMESQREALTETISGLTQQITSLNEAFHEESRSVRDNNALLRSELESTQSSTAEQTSSLSRSLDTTGQEFQNIAETLQGNYAECISELNQMASRIDELARDNQIAQSVKDQYTPIYTYWAKVWKNYLDTCGPDEFNHEFMKLIQGLDAESHLLLEHHFKMYKTVVPLTGHSENVLVHQEAAWSEIDRIRLQTCPSIRELQGKYSFLEGMDIPVNYESIRNIFGLKYFPEEVLSYLQGKDIIDGGAWVGDSSIVLSDFTNAVVHAFEPCPQNYALLKEVVQNGWAQQIKPRNNALLDKSGEVSIYSHNNSNDLGASISKEVLHDYNQPEIVLKKQPVQAVSIDEYVQSNSLKVGLIKLDIEGAERKALKGAQRTIAQQRPLLIVALYHHPLDMLEIKPWLEGLGVDYNIRIRRLTYENPAVDMYLLAYPNSN